MSGRADLAPHRFIEGPAPLRISVLAVRAELMAALVSTRHTG